MSFAGILLGAVTALLGGELVDRLDAPNSLSGQPADAMPSEAPGHTRQRG